MGEGRSGSSSSDDSGHERRSKSSFFGLVELPQCGREVRGQLVGFNGTVEGPGKEKKCARTTQKIARLLDGKIALSSMSQ